MPKDHDDPTPFGIRFVDRLELKDRGPVTSGVKLTYHITTRTAYHHDGHSVMVCGSFAALEIMWCDTNIGNQERGQVHVQ